MEAPPPGAAADPAFLRPSRTDEVVFASQKVLLWEWELPYLRRDLKFDGPDLAELTPAAFADGHVNILRPSEALPAVVNPFLPDRPAERLAYTANGVRGRDLERR